MNRSRKFRRASGSFARERELSSKVLYAVYIVAAAVFGSMLAREIVEDESVVEAPAEPVTRELLESFMRSHSLLEYTTKEGDTLRSIATRLRRLDEIDHIRTANPDLADKGDDEKLEAGQLVRILYNNFELDDLLQGEGSTARESSQGDDALEEEPAVAPIRTNSTEQTEGGDG
jgi:phage tail protein X